MEEGNTRLYEIQNFLPRVFFVENVIPTGDKNGSIKAMFKPDFSPLKEAVVEDSGVESFGWFVGVATITKYEPNEVTINTSNPKKGFLVLTDSYYPTWKAEIDGVASNIYLTDYAFRGLIVPAGQHRVRLFI